jgi:hypothetical protein
VTGRTGRDEHCGGPKSQQEIRAPSHHPIIRRQVGETQPSRESAIAWASAITPDHLLLDLYRFEN